MIKIDKNVLQFLLISAHEKNPCTWRCRFTIDQLQLTLINHQSTSINLKCWQCIGQYWKYIECHDRDMIDSCPKQLCLLSLKLTHAKQLIMCGRKALYTEYRILKASILWLHRLVLIIHSQKELAHWTVGVTAQIYACCSSSWLRCNYWTAFALPKRLHIYIWPIKNNENTGQTKLAGVEIMIISDGVYMLLKRSDAHQWVYLRKQSTDFVHDSKMKINTNLSEILIDGGLSNLF